jgi:hypothetical protein
MSGTWRPLFRRAEADSFPEKPDDARSGWLRKLRVPRWPGSRGAPMTLRLSGMIAVGTISWSGLDAAIHAPESLRAPALMTRPDADDLRVAASPVAILFPADQEGWGDGRVFVSAGPPERVRSGGHLPGPARSSAWMRGLVAQRPASVWSVARFLATRSAGSLTGIRDEIS